MINQIKEKDIQAIKEDSLIRELVSELYVFGSTITNHCTDESDIDLYIKMREDCYDRDNELCLHFLDIVDSDLDLIFDHILIKASPQLRRGLDKAERIF